MSFNFEMIGNEQSFSGKTCFYQDWHILSVKDQTINNILGFLTIFSLSLFPYLLTHPQQISLQYKSIYSLLDKTIKHAFLLTTKQTVKMIL